MDPIMLLLNSTGSCIIAFSGEVADPKVVSSFFAPQFYESYSHCRDLTRIRNSSEANQPKCKTNSVEVNILAYALLHLQCKETWEEYEFL